MTYALPIVDDNVLSTYKEKVSNLQSVQRKITIDEKMQSLNKNRT